MRCSMLETSPSAPSAVWAKLMPSFELRTAWFMPRICAVIDEAMARPAASSLAELMRLPLDRRSIAVCNCWLATRPPFWARNAEVLVLIIIGTSFAVVSGSQSVAATNQVTAASA